MARTAATSSNIIFTPSSILDDFLGSDYTYQGLAQATLANILPIYPLPSLQSLAQLQRFSSDRNKRAGDESPLEDECAFSLVMFKKFNSNLLPGLSVHAFPEFFTDLLVYQSSEEHDAFNVSTMSLLDNSNYMVVAVTAPMFSSQDPTKLTYYIIAAALYMYNNKLGNCVALLGTTDIGDPSICTLSERFFVDQSNSGLLQSNPSSFRGLGLASFLLSTIQVLGQLRCKPPRVLTS
jgi:hypothetical protein